MWEFWIMALVMTVSLVGGTACSIAVRRMDKRALHSPEVQAELDREEREDGELEIVKRKFINDEISMLEFEGQVVQILNGTWTNRPSPYGTIAEITTREGYHRGAVTHMPPPTTPPPKPSDAGRTVRSYSYPSEPCSICDARGQLIKAHGVPYCRKCWDKRYGFTEIKTDRGTYLCTRDRETMGACACPECEKKGIQWDKLERDKERWYEELEMVHRGIVTNREFIQEVASRA